MFNTPMCIFLLPKINLFDLPVSRRSYCPHYTVKRDFENFLFFQLYFFVDIVQNFVNFTRFFSENGFLRSEKPLNWFQIFSRDSSAYLTQFVICRMLFGCLEMDLGPKVMTPPKKWVFGGVKGVPRRS